MKRVLLAVFLVGIVLGSAFGAPTDQKIYLVNSEPFQIITSLYITQGLALPSTAGPHSGDELKRMLDLIEVDRLTPELKNIYKTAHDSLYQEQKVVNWGLEAALEAYIHTDTTNFTLEEDWVRGHDERSPLLQITLETFPSKHFYGYSEFAFNNTKYTGYDTENGTPTSSFFGKSAVTSNLFFLPPGEVNDLDLAMPYRAFGAFGGANWSVQIGRDKLSWGAGKTGNFMLSDSLRYHNMGRFTTYGKNFKYSLVTSFFPHPKQYHGIIKGDTYFEDDDEDEEPPIPYNDTEIIENFLDAKTGSQANPLSGINMFLAHRLEGRLFGGKVGLALSESIIYQSEDNTLDLRLLNPSMIYHNYYIRKRKLVAHS